MKARSLLLVLFALALTALTGWVLLTWVMEDSEIVEPAPGMRPRPAPVARVTSRVPITFRPLKPRQTPEAAGTKPAEVVRAPAPAQPQAEPSRPIPKGDPVLGGVQGRVLDAETGEPISTALVWVAGVREEVGVDARGRFSIAAPAGSNVVVVARAPAYVHGKASAVAQVGYADKLLELRLKPSETGRLEGRAIFDGERPETFTIFLDLIKHDFSAPDGHFVIDPVNVGQHTIGLAVPGKGGGSPLSFQTITVKPGETTEVQLTMPELAAIAGIVRDEKGQPLDRGFVIMNRLIIAIHPGGRFLAEKLLPGSYNIVLQHPDYGRCDGGPLRLLPGESRRDLELKLEPRGLGSLNGRVIRNGEPIPQCRIRLNEVVEQESQGMGRLAAMANFDSREVLTDAQGRFHFLHLKAGRYQLEARVGGDVLRGAGEVFDDETTTVELTNDE